MGKALYNENDPYAAQWLRNLISRKLIADGDVAECSIVDLTSTEVARYTQFHAFAGIGGWSYAARLAGWPDDRPVWTGSAPYQPFSLAGKQKGFDDKRHLWPEFRRLIRECRPPTIFGEQVAARLNGSDLCEVTWKPWATPWGQSLSKPRARVRTTCATDSGLWATIRASDGEKGGPNQKFGAGGQPLPAQAAWATPTTRDWKDGKPSPNVPINGLLGRQVWPTPTSLAPATWPTATATERIRDEATFAKCLTRRKERAGQNTVPIYLAEAAMGATGTQAAILNGSSEQTERRGALNPEFVCWLMGFPIEWVSCGVSATRSSRRSAQNSSKPISNAGRSL